jgi:hypothetical protein
MGCCDHHLLKKFSSSSTLVESLHGLLLWHVSYFNNQLLNNFVIFTLFWNFQTH